MRRKKKKEDRKGAREEERKREREDEEGARRGSRRIRRWMKENRRRSSWRAQVRAACTNGGGKMDPCWVIYSGPVGSKGAALSPRRTP